ncbi:MAG: zf-HC2 domain-containing protein [Candidatus Eremiobacteraeota bacterium]|nr:zf-HC2 domain-containing protein [Candidatus Eremiobacteraeota bacterium]
MRCSSCEPLLDRYVEGTLRQRQMLAVTAHLKSCDACVGLVNELRVVDALMATTKAADLPANFTFAVMAEVRTMPVAIERRISVWSFLIFYLVAAWIALSGAFAYFGGRVAFVQHAGGSIAASLHEIAAAIGGIAHGIGPAAPIALALGAAVLIIDVLLAVALFFFYRSIRPRLVAALARSEAS